jgi:hypothetical protein
MKINENELTQKVLNRLKNNTLVNRYTKKYGQMVTHNIFDDTLELDVYAAISVKFLGQHLGYIHDENRLEVLAAIKNKIQTKALDAFALM